MTSEQLAGLADCLDQIGFCGVASQVRLLAVPLDLDGLVVEGKLHRLSASRYRVLVPLHALPDYVTAQAVHLDADGTSTVLHFARA